MMKGFVDIDTCIGCGLCEGICPKVFKMEADGIASASEDEISEELVKSAIDACEQCPVEAITVE